MTHIGQMHQDNEAAPQKASSKFEEIQKKNQELVQSRVAELHANVATITKRINDMKQMIKATREHALTVRKVIDFAKPISKEGKPND